MMVSNSILNREAAQLMLVTPVEKREIDRRREDDDAEETMASKDVFLTLFPFSQELFKYIQK